MTKRKRTRLAPQARRAQLLDSAAAIIQQCGLSGFTMDALAREAGVSNPLVYKYFDTRRELLQELLVRESERFSRELSDRLAKAETFEEIVRIVVALNFDEADRGSVRQILRSQPDIREVVREKEVEDHRRIGRFLVSQLEDSFALTRTQAEQIVILGSGASVAAAERVRKKGWSREKLIGDTVRFIFGGIDALKKPVRQVPRAVAGKP